MKAREGQYTVTVYWHGDIRVLYADERRLVALRERGWVLYATPAADQHAGLALTDYRDGSIQTALIGPEEAANVGPDGADVLWNRPYGRICIRLASGKSIEYLAGMPGCGPASVKLLLTLMAFPGRFWNSGDVAKLTDHFWLVSANNTSGRVAAIRRACGESGQEPRLILTQRHPYAVCWNRSCAWRLVDCVSSMEAEESCAGA